MGDNYNGIHHFQGPFDDLDYDEPIKSGVFRPNVQNVQNLCCLEVGTPPQDEVRKAVRDRQVGFWDREYFDMWCVQAAFEVVDFGSRFAPKICCRFLDVLYARNETPMRTVTGWWGRDGIRIGPDCQIISWQHMRRCMSCRSCARSFRSVQNPDGIQDAVCVYIIVYVYIYIYPFLLYPLVI